MSQQTANSRFINTSARCIYLYPNGRRCRLYPTALNPNFCPAHTPLPLNQPGAAEIASTLTLNLNDFTSASQINDFLSRLLLLLAQDKISTRRAAVLAYITNQLLRTLPAIAKEEDAEGQSMIDDISGPDPAHQSSGENPASPIASPDDDTVPE